MAETAVRIPARTDAKPASASALVEALRAPRCYPHPVGQVEVCETHISYVLLAGDFAYKIKKPVKLDFLDFSTLGARRRYCLEELRLNRRTAPDLYLGVVAIGGDPPAIRHAGYEPAVEYAVRMRRFPQGDLLDRRARAGLLEPAEVDALARAVARFHAEAARVPQASACADDVTAPVVQNLAELSALVDTPEQRAVLMRLREWTWAEQGALGARFGERHAAGFVRDCHGDLHLGNVVLLDGEPTPFDCIEFSEAFRHIDVVSDVAFTAMDLARLRVPRLAFRFLNEYFEATGDYEGLSVLRYYLVYRALVRAKVAALRAHQGGGETAARAAFEDHLALALRLSHRPARVLILMHGLCASGKTTASQRLLEALGAIRLRSDVERKRLHGLAAGARTGSAPGEGLYSEPENAATYERLAGLARHALDAGFPVIVDATFLKHWQRDAFRAVAAATGAGFQIGSCTAPADVLRERLAAREIAGRDASEAGVSVLERQQRTCEPLAADELVHAVVFDMTRPSEWHGTAESLARRLRPLQG